MINLLSDKKIKFDKETRLARRAKVWSGFILVVYVTVMVLSVLVGQIYAMRMDRTQKALDDARFALTSKIVLIGQYESVVERAAVIKQLLEKRRAVIGLWNNVQEMLPEEVELIQFGLVDTSLSLAFEAAHVVRANQMLEVIETRFGEIEAQRSLVDVNRDSGAVYRISAEVLLP